MSDVKELDVTVIEPRQKHVTIFSTFNALQAGESFVLKNDHDPRPLRHQFDAQHENNFSWEYLEQGPEWWRVRLTKVK